MTMIDSGQRVPIEPHDAPPAIRVRELRRSFGPTVALDGATFTVRAGAVTGFLGPNGAGKSTALRILLGLDRADSGEALVSERPFRELEQPARTVGALLDGSGFHPGRSARQHLRVLADLAGIPTGRVEQVLADVGLEAVADRRVGGFSLGMRRRLGLASALLGDPDVLILDEPANGLDPAGSRWLRETLRAYSAGGRTVLLSSHALADIALVADDVVVIHHGRVVAQTGVDQLVAGEVVIVRARESARLADAVQRAGASIRRTDDDRLELTNTTQESVGLVAAAEGIALVELTARHPTLEETFLALTEEPS